MEIYINNQQSKVEIGDDINSILKELINFVMSKEQIKDYELGVTLVDDTAIRELNDKFRNKNVPTDVLSFPLSEDDVLSEDSFVLGDIVISLETAQRQACEYGHSLVREMAYLLVHGIYHVLGFTHDDDETKEAMRKKEEEVLQHFQILR